MTLRIEDLRPTPGSRKREKRLGRGSGSGHGKTSTRGHKGQKAHGQGVRPGFEGGQTPINRRFPKKGFKNFNAREYVVVNLKTLEEKFESGETVNPQILKEKKIIKQIKDGVKILGEGELTKALKVQAHAFSARAKEKIEQAGGTFEVI
ncbi:MAG: large subunit ribosomal protein [Thermotogota bacterium]|nr:large subunit ribosomal protein [Thermotogota bacterium]MDK2864143.1 large subunit ribosomal protein [Thermotogota bacterium]HCZ06883.1 50S ribosomal protein L15 [Thermotogota bacterium]